MVDLLLAIAHHLLVFGLVAILAAELALLRPGIRGERLRLVGGIDMAYGALATLLIIVGFLRVFLGFKGPDAYLPNWVFWAKIGAFVIVGLLSIQPTASILGWRNAAQGDPAYVVPAEGIARSRTFLWAEAVVFVLIPVFAAMMARGYGL
jgi:putative membrane protein